LLVDFDHRGHLRPLGEIVDGDIEISVPSNGLLQGFIDQHAGGCVVFALASMDLCEQLVALLLGYALH
jgi:hypothetical protein